MRSLFLLIHITLASSIFGYGSASFNSSGIILGKQIRVLKIDIHLSALGVESDDFPSIDASVDFVRNSSVCYKTYYDPAYKGSTYHLSTKEISQVLALLQKADFANLKKHYRILKTDQPTSTITVYTEDKTYSIEDYGLQGEYSLQQLYSLVYKF